MAAVSASMALLVLGISYWSGLFSGQPDGQPSTYGSSNQSSLAGSIPRLPRRNHASHTSRPDNTERFQPGGDADGDHVREAILGTWEQHSIGHRIITIQEDGKASVDVTLDGVWAFTFGEKLTMDVQWEFKNDRLIFKTTGGTPESSVNAITSLYGDNRVYDIIEITEEQILLEEDGEKKNPWKRVKAKTMNDKQ